MFEVSPTSPSRMLNPPKDSFVHIFKLSWTYCGNLWNKLVFLHDFDVFDARKVLSTKDNSYNV
jgi:hypothetical protein